MNKVPVALIIYNRPKLTARVMEAIRAYAPLELFVIADGPKLAEDAVLCAQARLEALRVDWDCKVHTDFSLGNMGCVPRIVSGVTAVFDQRDRAIVLEDDCVPELSFFRFCEELLELYQDDEQVMHISGCNLREELSNGPNSYFFTNYAMPSWGWASWARAWKKFNPKLDSWQQHKKEIHHHISQEHFAKWTDTFEYIRQHGVGWDVPWNVDIWAHRGISVMPCKNLVTNIGFHNEATFTKNEKSSFSDLRTWPMSFPLVHPGERKPMYDRELEAAAIQLLRDMD